MKRQSKMLSVLLVVIIAGSSTQAIAQDKDPIELARDYPPSLIQVDVAQEQMQWQIKRLREQQAIQEQELRKIDDQITELNQEINALTKKLPVELRFANESVRAQLIGDVLRELLASRLEVASQQELIEQLTVALEDAKMENSKADEIRQQKHQLMIKASETKLALAEFSFEQTAKMAKSAAVSQSELEREKYSYELAKMELEHALLDFEMESTSRGNEVADRLVKTRISLQPAKARVAAAERFLNLFSESRGAVEMIAETNRKIARLNEHRQRKEQGIWATKENLAELSLLFLVTKSSAEEFEKNKQQTKE